MSTSADHHITINLENIPSISATSSINRLHNSSNIDSSHLPLHHDSASDHSNDSHRNRYSTSSANESNLSAYTDDRLSRSVTTNDEDDAEDHDHRNKLRSNSSNRLMARPINGHHKNERDTELGSHDDDPLLDTEMIPKNHPPIAHPETEDDTPDNDIPNTADAHPGVDDGFFPVHHPVEKPTIKPKSGHDDGHGHGHTDNGYGHTDNGHGPSNGHVPRRRPSFPYAPGFEPDVLLDSEGNPMIIPDVNVYQHKKTLAQGMMDLALLSANANQLRYVLESRNRHPYYYFSLSFISLSLLLQVAVGIGLIWNSRYNVKNEEHICKADKINNLTVLGIFLITIVNVFITSFGVADTETRV